MSILVLVMTMLIVYDVSMRALFKIGSVGIQEMEWHLFGIIFLIGAAYTFKEDGHVRVEIVYQRLGDRGREWANIAGNLIFLIPLCVLVMWAAWPFVANAFINGETSPDPGGLPFRYLIKAVIPAGFLLLLLHAVADTIKRITRLEQKNKDGC